MEDSRLNKSKTSKLKVYSDFELNSSQLYQLVDHINKAEISLTQISNDKVRIKSLVDNSSSDIFKANLDFHLRLHSELATLKSKSWFSLLKNKRKSESKSLEILKGLKDNPNINSFLKSQIGISSLDMISQLHFVTHKKGEVTAYHNSLQSDQQHQMKISVEEFNDIFNSIRKSKQSTFAESFLKSHQIKLVGTCLAKAASFKSHNFILIGTRNEFIPFAKNEIERFNIFSQITLPLFDMMLQTKTESQLVQKLKEILNQIESNSLNLKKIHSEYHVQRVSLLGELLNTLRHELSNPLFGIQLSANLLAEEFQGDDKELAEQIQEAVNKSLKILNGFSKLYGPMDQVQNVSVISLINEVFTLTKSETKMLEREINVSPNLMEENAAVEITTNSTSLSQIFFNLILNSSQAMQDQTDPKPKITISLERDLTDIKIIFSDNGPGIPVQNIDEIFDSFYTTKETGTGLGLPICRSLVRKLGGDMWCVKNDKGAQFVLVLPHEGLVS
ncbi:MAG: hypothetical protein CME65_09615 [Halobacteriovoraceae bacterium]|nr:hypothetical protein [Halobacteriovoraceae bacterium]